MFSGNLVQTARFDTRFFPQHVLLLTIGENLMPMGYWPVISKDPFRFLICMGVGNHSLLLLKKYKEAALHFMPWSRREQVVRAGYLSGRDVKKADVLGFNLLPAEKLQHTRLVEGADSVFETVVYRELPNLSRVHALRARCGRGARREAAGRPAAHPVSEPGELRHPGRELGVHQVNPFGTIHPAPPRYRGMTRSSLYIPMRDGVKLALTLVLPKDLPAGERIPCLLSQSRYWRDYELYPPLGKWVNPEQLLPRQRNFKPFFSGQGYALANLDVRGTGASFGNWPMPWHAESVEDARQVVDWIIEQPWSNGLVGGYGISYVGTTAELLAALGHPAVKAVIPMFNHPDPFTDIAYPGGAFNRRFVDAWDRLSAAMDRNQVTPELGWRAKVFLRGVPPVDEDRHRTLLRQALQVHAGNTTIFKIAEPISCRNERISGIDASVDDISMYRYLDELERSGTAIFGWASWMDAGTADAVLRRFNTLPNARRAVIGAWEHGGVYNASPYRQVRRSRLPAEASPPLMAQWAEMLAFFDAYLKAEDLPLRSERVLHYYSLGDEKWKQSATWPPPGTSMQRWRLSAGMRLLPNPPADESGVDTYAVDWNATTGALCRWWELGGALGKPVSYPTRDKAAKHLLTYTSPLLEKDLEIAGYPVVDPLPVLQ